MGFLDAHCGRAAREREFQRIPGAQASAGAHDAAIGPARDGVAALEHRGRIEVGEAEGKARKVFSARSQPS